MSSAIESEMSSSSTPNASENVLESLVQQMKLLTNKELVKLQKGIMDEMCRRADSAGKGAKEPKERKSKKAAAVESSEESEKVKRQIPPHLRQNHEWTAYVRDYSRENGWPSFTWNKDAKVMITMPAGEEKKDGSGYEYPNLPAGHNHFTDAHAMSLAPELKVVNPELWEKWLETIYQPTEEEKAKAEAAKDKPKAAVKPKENNRERMSFEAYVTSIDKKVEEEKAKEERKAAREAKKASLEKVTEEKKSVIEEVKEPKAKGAAKAEKAEKVEKVEKVSKGGAKAAKAAVSVPAVEEIPVELASRKKAAPKAKEAKEAKETEAQRIRRTWVTPSEGLFKKYYYIDEDGNDVECLRGSENEILTIVNNVWVGELKPDNTVDYSVEDPFMEDDE